MDDDNLQPKSNFKMAELFMECEEEELEPWQKKAEEIEDEDDDELIFVGEISSSKPAISNILNRGNSSSSSKGIKNETLSQGAPDTSKPTSQQPTNSTSNPVAASPRFHHDSKSSHSTIIVQSLSKPDYTKNSSHMESDDSSDLLFDLTQETPLSQSQEAPAVTMEDMDQSSSALKRPSTSEANSVNPKKPKTLVKSSVSFLKDVQTKGTNTSSTQCKTEPTCLRACPKCNVKFHLLDPLKYHMKHCCPEMINNFLEMIKTEVSNTENQNTGAEKGKLIMLVSDFYYGRHEGNVEEEQKTYTTFKCFSCLKVLKNNIRFMNHMKHHLELEKQNSESWENHTTCQHCYRQYPTPFQLQCHIETICKICELSFESEHILLQHMKDTHKPGEMPYICQVCQYRSSSFSDVETHFRASHENTKNLLCPFCLKVSKMATPYMNHYMKHQKKGIHRCSKCRLQFLTCKEKIEHKIQHRTFIKPKALEGLPPGTKVTIRASIGPLQSKSSTTPSSSTPSTSTLQVSPPKSKNNTAKNSTKSNASKSKTNKPHAVTSTAGKSHASKPHLTTSTAGKPHATPSTAGKPHANKPHATTSTAGKRHATTSTANKPHANKHHATTSTASKRHATTSIASKRHATTSIASKPNANKSNASRSKYKSKTCYKQKKQRNRKDQISTALKNLRYCRGIHKCIECRSKIKDFASHFSTFVRCNFCKYNSNCSKAFVNHLMSSHSNHPSKRFCIFKKHSGSLRGMTLVCLKCDFLTNSSGLDQMAKHLSQRKTHTCQIITENVSDSTSSESTSDCLLK
ncbi:zinc finger protein 280C-like isoform X2 [Choloepus didactylus]|uniref:zinc finger protein 280C-like isoform X2 n=1 Tax=Choloepus didactylus TaxID=27675 RepID=UPI00189FB5C4|nr:zinc finger protein 280C-like isoform X2 [Choloepus didactylus]